MGFDIEENVTKLIPKPEVKYEDPPIYISKFHESVRSALSSGKSSHKTLGLPRIPLNSPKEFLRKRSRTDVKRPDIQHKHYRIPNYPQKLPAWESVKRQNSVDKCGENQTLTKNFKKQNIINVTNSKPKTPTLYYVDDRYGNAFPQKPNCASYSNNLKDKDDQLRSKAQKIQKQCKEKKSFVESKKDIKILENSTDSFPDEISDKHLSTQKTSVKSQSCYISQEERSELLKGMKKRREELMKQFQGLPFLTDTPPKVKRKAKMEQDLRQLEKDIDMIERYKHIYVRDDDNY